MIFNTIFCVLLLKEKLYFIRLVALVVICLGSSLFLGLGENNGGTMTLEEILDLYARPISVVYIAIIVSLISCFFILNFKIQRRLEHFYSKCWTLQGRQSHINASAFSSGLRSAGTEMVPAFSKKTMVDLINVLDQKTIGSFGKEHLGLKQGTKTSLVALAMGAGMCGGLLASIIKGATLTLKTSGWWWSILFLALALAVATVQLKTLNVAMESFDQISIDPIYEISLMIFNMLGGAIVLDEQKMYSWARLAAMLGASMICMFGVVLMVRVPKSEVEGQKSDVVQLTDLLGEEELRGCIKGRSQCECLES